MCIVELIKPTKTPYYQQKSAGKYLYSFHKGNWDLSTTYEKFFSYIKQHHIRTIGDIYAYDLAGFMINGVENNSMTIISIQVI